jgi:Excalibur calcium-binding domain
MFVIAALIAITPIQEPTIRAPLFETELSYTKKKKGAASSGNGHKFSSCKAARKAGYTHMRRGRPGYSTNLDRDGDGVACDKVK